MVLREKLYTAEEFFEIAQLPENEDKRLELDDEVIVEMGSSSRKNTIVAMRIAHFFNAFVIPRRLGYVTGPDGGYKLATGKVRRPDVGFISIEHGIDLEGLDFTIAPDVAVTVKSPDKGYRDLLKKAKDYLANGSRMVWLVYPEKRLVEVHTPDDVDILTIEDTIEGGDVLPGFTLPVKDIFLD